MTTEPSDGEAIEAPDEEGEIVAITGDGVQRRRVRPDCPICTGGTGLPCPWH